MEMGRRIDHWMPKATEAVSFMFFSWLLCSSRVRDGKQRGCVVAGVKKEPPTIVGGSAGVQDYALLKAN